MTREQAIYTLTQAIPEYPPGPPKSTLRQLLALLSEPDPRALLKRYMAHVIEVGGVSFVRVGLAGTNPAFTAEERDELLAIETEIRNEEKPHV